jgi:hypothetical protein
MVISLNLVSEFSVAHHTSNMIRWRPTGRAYASKSSGALTLALGTRMSGRGCIADHDSAAVGQHRPGELFACRGCRGLAGKVGKEQLTGRLPGH